MEHSDPYLEREWFTRLDMWVNVIRLPLHLWSLENAVSLAEELGDGYVEVDKECIEFTIMDMLGIKVRVGSMRRTFEPFTVTDGTRENNIVALPVVYQRDLKWDEKRLS